MKGKFILLFVLVSLLFVAPAFADSSWKLAGTWNYTANVPSTTLNTGDIVSATERGTITAIMTEKDGAEYFDSYVIQGKGTATLNGKSYPYEYPASTVALKQDKYTPGNTIKYNDTTNINGIVAKTQYVFTQTGENTISGTITMTWNGNTATGTISATRPTGGDSGGGGGCNAGLAGFALLALVPMIFRRKK